MFDPHEDLDTCVAGIRHLISQLDAATPAKTAFRPGVKPSPAQPHPYTPAAANAAANAAQGRPRLGGAWGDPRETPPTSGALAGADAGASGGAGSGARWGAGAGGGGEAALEAGGVGGDREAKDEGDGKAKGTVSDKDLAFLVAGPADTRPRMHLHRVCVRAHTHSSQVTLHTHTGGGPADARPERSSAGAGADGATQPRHIGATTRSPSPRGRARVPASRPRRPPRPRGRRRRCLPGARQPQACCCTLLHIHTYDIYI